MDRRVRTVEEIVFEKADPPVTLAKGSVYSVEAVLDNGEYEYPQLSASAFRHAFQLRLLRENRSRPVRDRVPRRLRRNHADAKLHCFAGRQALLPCHRRHATGEDNAANNDSNCNVSDFHRKPPMY